MSKFVNNHQLRHREQKRWFRKSLAVLQIGEEFKKGIYVGQHVEDSAPPSWDENEIIVVWRDADMADATFIHELAKKLTQT